MKKFFKAIIHPFLPTYEVTFTMYHVIPGAPVKRNDMTHNFAKGASAEAEAFFNKVVTKTMENKMAPTEVKLKRGKRVIKYQQFGPINEIRKYKIVA